MNEIRRALAVLLAACLMLPAAAFAQKVLRYSDHEPLGGMRTRFIKDVFFAAVERESQGRLRIDDRWDSTVSTGYDALRKIGEGREADMAVIVPEYTAKELPLHQLFKSFPKGPTGQQQVDFFRRTYAEIPEFPEELRRNNVVPLFLATGYPVAFFSSLPLDKLEAIQGTTWRSASFWHFDFLRNAGARPVTMPWGEGVFKAMQARTLDGLMVNVDSGYMLNVHSVAPNVLLSKDLWLGHLYVVAMNRATWEGLAPQDRDAIQRAAATAYQTLGAVMDRAFDEQVADLRKAGVKVRLLEAAELRAWNAATRYTEVQQAWARDQEAKGVKDAVQVLRKLDTLMGAAAK